jgi:hypothetical protein
MIGRIWHGYTTPENADAYELLLKTEIFTGILDRKLEGFHGIELYRRDVEAEVEFITIMSFDTLESIKIFAGDDYEAAVVPPKARALLKHFDSRSQHYEIKISLRE